MESTRGSQFVTIKKPKDSDVNLSECRIDLNDKDQELSFKQCTDEFDMWYELENARIRYLIYTFTLNMIKNGKIFDKDPNE